MGQMATSLNTLLLQNSDKLPSQTVLNPRNVQAATKPSFATFFPSVLQEPNWTPPFDLECDIVVYALGNVLASFEFDFLPP
ncbi:hypothetical protein Lal_00015131 [Lupinus albus]|nr:hypothetical protein Lal_00015131 [Lupinus albus]